MNRMTQEARLQKPLAHYTINPSIHGQQRMNQRDIGLRDLQKARERSS